MDYDVIVIGAGPGGYVAAIRAAQLGLKVAVVEEDRLGGVCLNRGCIPTKALLASCRVLNQARRAGEFGILSDSISFDWEKIQARKNRVVSGLVEGIEKLFKHHRISLYQGRGKLT
ncbi:FAD-dependent oxidoreductase, partial [candidate division KSB1 bacterium]|nr:FAD-dependent oxidoreductase [candidate division KSB1 bacterium]